VGGELVAQQPADVTCSFDGTAQMWDATNGTSLLIYRVRTDQPDTIARAVAWSPDGTRIATAAYAKVFVWQAS